MSGAANATKAAGLGRACSAPSLPLLRQRREDQQRVSEFWDTGGSSTPSDHGTARTGPLGTARTGSKSPSKAASEWGRSERLLRAYRCAPARPPLQMGRSPSNWFSRILDDPIDHAGFQRQGFRGGSPTKTRKPEKSHRVSTGPLPSAERARPLPRCAKSVPLFTIIDGL